MDEIGKLLGLNARLTGTAVQALYQAGLLTRDHARECAEDLIALAEILDGHMPDSVPASPLATSLHRIGRQLQE